MKFVRHPKQIFTAFLQPGKRPRNLLREDELGKLLVWHAQKGPSVAKPPSEKDLRYVHYYPGCTRFIGPKAVEHPLLLNTIKQDPYTALLYLVHHYHDVASVVEPFVLVDGSAACHLLDWADAKGVQLLQPRDTYLDAIARDPFWAHKRLEKTKDPALARKLVEFVSKNKEQCAGAAYVHIMSDDVKNAAPFIPVLAQDPFYACLATKMKGRLKGVKICSSDVGRRLTAKWAFFFLSFGNVEDPAAFVNVVNSDPAWWIEYAIFRGRMIDAKPAAEFDALFKTWAKQEHPYLLPAKEFMEGWVESLRATPRAAA